MPKPSETVLTFRPLYNSSLITVRNYQCHAGYEGPSDEEQSDSNSIVLMRHGAFCKHVGRRGVTVDVNEVGFFSKGSTYRVSHPADCGDRGTVFTPSLWMLNDIVRELDPSIDDHPERPFSFIAGPCDSHVFWRHHEFARRLETAKTDPPDPLWTELTALQLVASVLEAPFARQGQPCKRRRKGTENDHAERVEAAKFYFAARLAERITLEDVAGAVYVSPFHFARVFQRYTGIPVHRYLTRLRLRTALERLAEGADDLTTLAFDIGFSSHSHFTDAFRREFDRSPSHFRRHTSSRTLREMSKNLKV